jgi:uncharacterized protein (DUF2141 family)
MILGLLVMTQLLCQPALTSTLEIEITGIRGPEGQIAVGLSKTPQEWPHEPSQDFFMGKKELNEGALTLKISSMAQGTYAIAVLDDENSNQKMDTFLGIPREGYGFSRNPATRLGHPRFEECSIELNQPRQKITIELKYPGRDRASGTEEKE